MVSGIQVEGAPAEIVELSLLLLQKSANSGPSGSYNCVKCGKSFTTAVGRGAHMRVHKRAKPK